MTHRKNGEGINESINGIAVNVKTCPFEQRLF